MSRPSSDIARPAGAPASATAAAPQRAAFAAASFANLRAAAGEGQGEALRIALAQIDEDPAQPRTVFDGEALAAMAESIRLHGVVQPVVVLPPESGRYQLVFGARRLRASRLAGVPDIPAVIGRITSDNFAAQIIENQQRANLANSDLAAAITRLTQEGRTIGEIAAVCSLKAYHVSAFRQVGQFPPALVERIDNADMRALYDLYRQWGKTPEAVIALLPAPETYISVTEARRLISRITGDAAPKFAGTGCATPETFAPPHLVEAVSNTHGDPLASVSTSPEPDAAGRKPGAVREVGYETTTRAPAFIVALDDGRAGRLIVERGGSRSGLALVAYPTGVEEVEAAALRIVRME